MSIAENTLQDVAKILSVQRMKKNQSSDIVLI
jgi:hypothetical protein